MPGHQRRPAQYVSPLAASRGEMTSAHVRRTRRDNGLTPSVTAYIPYTEHRVTAGVACLRLIARTSATLLVASDVDFTDKARIHYNWANCDIFLDKLMQFHELELTVI